MKYILVFAFICFLLSCSVSRVSQKVLEREQRAFELATSLMGPKGAKEAGIRLDNVTAEELNQQGYIEMVAWKDSIVAHKFFGPVGEPFRMAGDYQHPLWVTQKSEFIERARALKLNRLKGARLALRLEQLLGLEVNPEKDAGRVIMEVWVRMEDLFRPCRDPEVTDYGCSPVFPGGAYALDYSIYQKEVYDTIIINNTKANPDPGATPYWAPWTRMGYTYDFNRRNKNNYGLSEFIVRKGATVKIAGKTPTEEWLADRR